MTQSMKCLPRINTEFRSPALTIKSQVLAGIYNASTGETKTDGPTKHIDQQSPKTAFCKHQAPKETLDWAFPWKEGGGTVNILMGLELNNLNYFRIFWIIEVLPNHLAPE